MISIQAEKTYIMLRNLKEQNRSKHYMNPNMNMNMNRKAMHTNEQRGE